VDSKRLCGQGDAGTATAGLIERLAIERALRRMCGFALCKTPPSEATFSLASDEFAQADLGQRVHKAMIREHLGDELIGHISRNGTAIEARTPVSTKKTVAEEAASMTQPELFQKQCCLRRGETRPPVKESPIKRLHGLSLHKCWGRFPSTPATVPCL
jgi:hypothetical protein